MPVFEIGQIVQVGDDQQFGTVRFVGQTSFAAGDWVGVELDGDGGKNDGSVQGERYFECEMGRGMFLRPKVLTIIEQPPTVTKPTPVPPKPAARPSSVVSSGLDRRMSAAQDTSEGNRRNMNAASPSPATRGFRSSSMLRVSPIEN
jgi:dynactin 1